MSQPAIGLILDEHRAMATVLRALLAATAPPRDPHRAPDFDRLRAIVCYLDDLPARLHHACESEMLFPRIRERCPALRPVLDRLEAEHAQSDASLRELERALGAWQVMGSSRRDPFETLARAYASMYLGHIEVEESYILPVARDFLTDADWRELDAALRARRGGTLARDLERDHRALYARIVTCTP
jgi:hemerythrin-like domain-containing protein